MLEQPTPDSGEGHRLRPGSPSMAAKRAFDLVVAAAALVVTSPLSLGAAVAVRLSMGAPVLFRQRRLGRDGEEFVLLKFRTMRDATGPAGDPLPDEARITGVGAWLRRTTLDELPELLNVIRGDLSLVGPRPLLPEYRELYSAEQWRRHEVHPGMAGPVLAEGRNALGWEEKFRWDVWYVDHWSLKLDLRILARSARNVLTGHGVSAEGHATMPRFEGTSDGDRTREPVRERHEPVGDDRESPA